MPITEQTGKPLLDLDANFTSGNPTPLENQICIETDTGRRKIGDGFTVWANLEYITDIVVIEEGNATSTYNPADGIEGGDANSVYSLIPVIDQGHANQPEFNIRNSWQTR